MEGKYEAAELKRQKIINGKVLICDERHWKIQVALFNSPKIKVHLTDDPLVDVSVRGSLEPYDINHSGLYYQHTQLSSTSSALNLIKSN